MDVEQQTTDTDSAVPEFDLVEARDLAESVKAYVARIRGGQAAMPDPEVLIELADGLSEIVNDLLAEALAPADPEDIALCAVHQDQPRAFLRLLTKFKRDLTLDERAYLERCLKEEESEGGLGQGRFYEFWCERLMQFRGSSRQHLLRVALGIHPEYGDAAELLPQLWEVVSIVLKMAGADFSADETVDPTDRFPAPAR